MSDDKNEGVWKWLSNDAPPTFTDWQPGQPNNDPDQDCAHFYHLYDYRWDDIQCTEYNLPLCEKR